MLPVAGSFLALDLVFVASNVHKIPAGGWFPLLTGALALTLMLCWRRGREIALAKRDEHAAPLDRFIAGLGGPGGPVRVPGTAVYISSKRDVVPGPLALNLRHNGVLHEHVVLLRVTTSRAPRVPEAERVSVREKPGGFRQAELSFGFAEKPDVPAALAAHPEVGCDPASASFFIGREAPVPAMHPELPRWQEEVYAFLARNAVRAPDYFLIPTPRVVELGTKVEL